MHNMLHAPRVGVLLVKRWELLPNCPSVRPLSFAGEGNNTIACLLQRWKIFLQDQVWNDNIALLIIERFQLGSHCETSLPVL